MTHNTAYDFAEPQDRALRSEMASVEQIVDHWRAEGPEWLSSHVIGWGEPFCFGCGWLPPSGRSISWSGASHLLDRAHLADHAAGGSGDPENLVMLCHLCHEAMPAFSDTAAALAWVQSVPRKHFLWQLWTDEMASIGRLSSATRGSTLNRLKAEFLQAMLAASTGTGSTETIAEIAASFDKG